MRYLGRITDWNDDKGFGFVTPNGGGDRAFVHVKAFKRQGRRPVSGDLIDYTVQPDAKGRLNASAVRFAMTRARGLPTARSRFPRNVVAGLAFAVLIAGWLLHKLPFGIVLVYAVMSGIAIVLYGFDKSAAVRGGVAHPKSTLHMAALLGGWPGALLAQDLFRHKSRKTDFQTMFWITVVANLVGLVLVLRSGASCRAETSNVSPAVSGLLSSLAQEATKESAGPLTAPHGLSLLAISSEAPSVATENRRLSTGAAPMGSCASSGDLRLCHQQSATAS